LLQDVDVIVMPTATMVAPTYAELEKHGFAVLFGRVHTQYWDAVGNPVLAVPMALNEDGLPLSLQIAGRPFDERRLISIATAYQRQTDWHERMPVLDALFETPGSQTG
jgi:aspartyl-tRNA(Asn)/glutamyl-tRNA(Gln) amidotransferase subunit A